jgi:hypothetical protein
MHVADAFILCENSLVNASINSVRSGPEHDTPERLIPLGRSPLVQVSFYLLDVPRSQKKVGRASDNLQNFNSEGYHLISPDLPGNIPWERWDNQSYAGPI